MTVTRNEMLAAYNARDAYILALAPVERGIAQEPIYLPNPARVFGPEPGFAEVSRAISVEAIRRAILYESCRTRYDQCYNLDPRCGCMAALY